ncbi:calcium-binding protein [Tsuneonella sp. HG222]
MAKGGAPGGGVSIKGTRGNDTFTVAIDSLARTTIDGSDGTDTLVLTGSTAVRIMLSDSRNASLLWVNPQAIEYHPYYMRFIGAGGTEVRGSLNGIENLVGGSGGDWLQGSVATKNTIDGGAGNDHLYGSGLGDVLFGGLGDDYLESTDDTVMTGGAGADTFLITWSDRATITDFDPGVDQLGFAWTNGTVNAMTAPRSVESAGGTTVYFDGQDSSVFLQGVSKADFDANTIVTFSIGTIQSTAPEVFRGGAGNDFFLAGSGGPADYFVIAGHDTIELFDVASDRLVLTEGTTIDWQAKDFGDRIGLVGYLDTDGDQIFDDGSVSFILNTLSQAGQIQIVYDAPIV